QRIEVAMQECVMNIARVTYQVLGRAAERDTNRTAGTQPLEPSGLFACKGGGPNDYCFVHARDTKQWQALLKTIGWEEAMDDPRFATAQLRAGHRAEIDEHVEKWTRQHHKHFVMKTLGEAGVPAGAVNDTNDLRADEHLRKRGTIVTIKHPIRG